MARDAFSRAQIMLSRRKHEGWVQGVVGFRSGVQLRRWHPLALPVQIAHFGHARHWGEGRRVDSPEIEHLDHYACLCTTSGRLAVIMSWPYQVGDVVRAYAATALPPPRFVVGVDNGREPLNPGSSIGVKGERTPSSIYGATVTGWIVADADTLGAERAAAIVQAFLAGQHGLAEAAEAQRALDLEEAALYRQTEESRRS